MPRTYKRVPGSRRYRDYDDKTLAQALDAIQSGCSQRSVSEMFDIPRSTLKNKAAGRHSKKPGGQTVLSQEVEKSIAKHCIALSDYGFPFDVLDLRNLVKTVLDKQGVKIRKFQDNYPGEDWTRLFLKRNTELTHRFSSNIKKKRAGVSANIIHEYFSHLSKEVNGVPPENIWNYDETNLTDDPGNRRVICKRGSKYPERIINTSKASISLMLCGNASGGLLPPYVVYKAEHLWSTWTEGGPKGTRYNRSKSGWFDGFCFSDWFFQMVLPVLKRQPGKKILLGDNLSSHVNIDVLKSCIDNDILFICLPPNSTHLTQPLDIAFFRPMKIMWRKLLTNWKLVERNQSSVMAKDQFPKQLLELWQNLEKNNKTAENLQSGFKKAGIHPLNEDEVLTRLPQSDQYSDTINDSFIERLSEMRKEVAKEPRRKKKRVDVVPGKSVSQEEVNALSIIERKKRSKKRQKEIFVEDEGSILMELGEGSRKRQEEDSSDESAGEQSTSTILNPAVGQYVIVSYDGELFPGIVKSLAEGGAEVSVMQKCGKHWKWPIRKDQIFYSCDQITKTIVTPDLINSRGMYRVIELESNGN